MGLSGYNVMQFVVVGIGGGIMGGFFGVGAAIIMVPLLIYWVFPAMNVPADTIVHLAFGTSLAIVIPTALSSSLAHSKAGNVTLAGSIPLSRHRIGRLVPGLHACGKIKRPAPEVSLCPPLDRDRSSNVIAEEGAGSYRRTHHPGSHADSGGGSPCGFLFRFFRGRRRSGGYTPHGQISGNSHPSIGGDIHFLRVFRRSCGNSGIYLPGRGKRRSSALFARVCIYLGMDFCRGSEHLPCQMGRPVGAQYEAGAPGEGLRPFTCGGGFEDVVGYDQSFVLVVWVNDTDNRSPGKKGFAYGRPAPLEQEKGDAYWEDGDGSDRQP